MNSDPDTLSTLFNDSITSCRIPSIWKSSIVIPIPKPGKDSSLSTSYRPISHLCPAAKVMGTLLLPTVNNIPASIRRPTRFPIRTLYHFCFDTTDEWYRDRFSQKKPPHRTVCVAVDLTAHSIQSTTTFMESSQLYAATLTHYSTEPLTTGPDYEPLLLLLALDGDVHPNPGPSRYPCLVCFKNVTSQGTSYLCTSRN